jgi:hypothetical protein
MTTTRRIPDLSAVRLSLDEAAGRITRIGYGVGVLGLLASGALAAGGANAWNRALQSWLVNWVFFLSLSLGALFFVLLQHVTKAGWSVVVRRLAESFAANFLVLAVLFVPLLFGLSGPFEWARPEVVSEDHLLQAKHAYLNPTFFLIRLAVYFAIWIFLSRFLLQGSLRQDESGDPSITSRLQNVSAPGMYAFALTTTFAGFDLLMSLEPRWYSTIFGVYFFSGCALSCFALLPLVTQLLQRSGRLVGIVSIEHYHDMGKLMFAFVVFWSYIAFSQYMLIWYANLPEETTWFLARQTGQWTAWSVFILFGHFLLPFLALISRILKRNPAALVFASVWLLLAHWADIYYLAMPSIGDAASGRVPLHLLDLTCFLAVGGFSVGAWAARMRGRSLLAQRDPRLNESLAFENF